MSGAANTGLSADVKAGTLASYLELTKPGITAFVTITAGVGYFMATRGGDDFSGLLQSGDFSHQQKQEPGTTGRLFSVT